MLVKDQLKKRPKKIITCEPSTTVPEAMELMIDHNIGCIPVMGSSGELAGIVDDKDIFRAYHENLEKFDKLTVGELMTSDLIIGLPDDDLNYIAGVMSKNNIRYIPIMDEGKMAGLISPGDVIKAQIEHIEIENRYLKLYIEGTQMG